MTTLSLSEPLDPTDSLDPRKSRLWPDPAAPLPMGYPAAVERAVLLRRKGSTWTWATVAAVMGEYHGFWRSAGWWASEVKTRDPRAARPRGVACCGPERRRA